MSDSNVNKSALNETLTDEEMPKDQWYVYETFKETKAIKLTFTDTMTDNDKINHALDMLEEAQDLSINPNDPDNVILKERYELDKEDKAESLKRSKGVFLENEKSKGEHKDLSGKPFNPKVMEGKVKNQKETLVNRCYYNTALVDAFFCHIHKQFHNVVYGQPNKKEKTVKNLIYIDGNTTTIIPDKDEIIMNRMKQVTASKYKLFVCWHDHKAIEVRTLPGNLFHYSPVFESNSLTMMIKPTEDEYKVNPDASEVE